MQGLYQEISEIPQRAQSCLAANQGLSLPLGQPYIGMGSSYYAALTLYYCHKDIRPEIASEYFYYLRGKNKQPGAVLISQSGESSETVWNLDSFDQVISITNNANSKLAQAGNVSQLVRLESGDEAYSSTKSYVNTLIALYIGLGLDPGPAVESLRQSFIALENQAAKRAELIAHYIAQTNVKGFYVIGSGPNYGTALQGALTLTETTKLSWQALTAAQYDHGPKEGANDTIVLLLNAAGKDQNRLGAIKQNLKTNSNALLVEINQTALQEQLSPILLIAELNFIMNFLADALNVGDTFSLGGKVTTTEY